MLFVYTCTWTQFNPWDRIGEGDHPPQNLCPALQPIKKNKYKMKEQSSHHNRRIEYQMHFQNKTLFYPSSLLFGRGVSIDNLKKLHEQHFCLPSNPSGTCDACKNKRWNLCVHMCVQMLDHSKGIWPRASSMKQHFSKSTKISEKKKTAQSMLQTVKGTAYWSFQSTNHNIDSSKKKSF